MQVNFFYVVLAIISITSLRTNAQNITFSEEQTLLFHPSEEYNHFNYPIIPCDYNQDGITDFFGSDFGDSFIFNGLPNGDFNIIELNWSTDPVKIVDFNNDGVEDFLFSSFLVYGSLINEFSYLSFPIDYTRDISDIGDFNGDGLNDAVTIQGGFPGDYGLSIILQQNDGSFIEDTISTSKFNYARVADFNLDGFDDILMAKSTSQLAISNGDGTFQISNLGFGLDKYETEIVDLNKDGYPDLITGGNKIYFNDGGILQTTPAISLPVTSVRMFEVADFNMDGYDDIVTFQDEYIDNIRYFTFKVFKNVDNEYFESQPTDLFSKIQVPSIWQIPNSDKFVANLNVHDFNNDGYPDIIFSEGFNVPNKVIGYANTSYISSTQNVDISNIKIYPNPASDIISLESNLIFKNILIKDALGNVESTKFTNKDDHIYSIDISNLPAGQYFLFGNSSNAIIFLEKFLKI